tara:strand:- start:2392 stop:2877 length:486 start_codon:yes stop_codon:yes gene_type:complete
VIDIDLCDLKYVAFDFDGVFTDNTVLIDESGREFVRCSRFDGIGLDKLRNLNIEMSIISSENNPLVLKRAEKLKIHCINSVSDKAIELKKNLERLNITEQNVMFVGNDINDIPAFKLARYSVGVADCHSEIEKYIDFKLTKLGGHGAVRELCDLIYSKLSN